MSSTITALTSGGGLAMAGDTSGQLELKTNNGTTAVTVTTAQDVGIGTTTPFVIANKNLTVNGTSSAIQLGVSGTRVGQFYSQGSEVRIGSVTSVPMTFYTNDTETMRIASSGEVLVGTTTSSSPSTGIALIPSFSTTNASGISISHASNASSGNAYLFFLYNTSGIGSITQSGTTAVLYNTTSDYRLKNDVAPIQNALTIINALNPVNFTWIDGRKDDGFLAHEIQAVIPNCVTGEKDAVDENDKPIYQQMDNSGVIPFLVKALQELNAKVDAQAAEIQALKGVA